MQACLIALPASACGAVVGFLLGQSQWCEVWPELTRLNAAWTTAMGWFAGIVVGLLGAGGLGLRRPASRKPAAGLWQRLLRGSAVALALAPGTVLVTVAFPRGVVRETGPVRRLLGDRRPNIVLIGIDALRADHLGAYGSQAGLTPNLDAFAREATVYQAAYSASSWTLPSYGAFFCCERPSACVDMPPGGVPDREYAERARLFANVSTLPEHLRMAGYRTAAELTNPFLGESRGWKRGFDYFRNEDGPNPDDLLTSKTARADVVTENAKAWLKLNRCEPFFLWVHYLDPHTPYDAPDTPAALRETYPRRWKTSRSYWDENMRDGTPHVRQQYAQYCRAMYAEEVRYVDRWVGELLSELRRDGTYDRSIIVITADHGEELFDHGQFEHGHSMHEEVLRVPLMVKWPKSFQADRTVSQTVALTDVAITLLELAGRRPIGDGRARPLARRGGIPGGAVYSEGTLHGASQTALTTDEYKVIYRPPVGGRVAEFEVYDRRLDRLEQHDLAPSDAAAGLRERLKALAEQAAAASERQGTHSRPSVVISDRERRRLESLGYLSD